LSSAPIGRSSSGFDHDEGALCEGEGAFCKSAIKRSLHTRRYFNAQFIIVRNKILASPPTDILTLTCNWTVFFSGFSVRPLVGPSRDSDDQNAVISQTVRAGLRWWFSNSF
jgi:hypothetical protein